MDIWIYRVDSLVKSHKKMAGQMEKGGNGYLSEREKAYILGSGEGGGCHKNVLAYSNLISVKQKTSANSSNCP